MNANTREAYNDWLTAHPDELDRTIPVSELFGPTIQGEGPHSGRTAWFLRLGGCNLSCDFCDTPYSTGTHGIPLSTIPRRTINSTLTALPPNTLIIITGGEPLMHTKSPSFRALLHGLKAKGCEIHIETNGTYDPAPIDAHIDHYTVSPKNGVTMARDRDTNHGDRIINWAQYANKTIFKYVVHDGNPDTFIPHHINHAHQHGIPLTHVWFMPEGTSTEQLQTNFAHIAQTTANHGANVTHRLHTLAWGNKKGH